MRIQIREGVALVIEPDGVAMIHSINAHEDFQITAEDETRARELLPKGIKFRG